MQLINQSKNFVSRVFFLIIITLKIIYLKLETFYIISGDKNQNFSWLKKTLEIRLN